MGAKVAVLDLNLDNAQKVAADICAHYGHGCALALQAVASNHYNVEVDDGEDVLLKKQDGERDVVVTVVENTVQGMRIDIDAE